MTQKERKYKSYVIKTIANDEIIHIYNGITDYKEALKLYKKTKEENKDKATVEFHGELPNGEFDLLFSKEIKFITDKYTTYDIYNDIVKIQNNLSIRKEYLYGFKGSYDKKIDNIKHFARNNKDVPTEVKAETFDKLSELETQRQNVDNEISLIKSMFNNGLPQYLEGICDTFKDIINKQQEKYDNIVNKKILPDKLNLEEIPYKSSQERVALMKKYKKKFDKVTYDENKNVVICYNKVRV